jgi:hypothetical protein
VSGANFEGTILTSGGNDPVNLPDLTGENPVVFMMLAGAMEGIAGTSDLTRFKLGSSLSMRRTSVSRRSPGPEILGRSG